MTRPSTEELDRIVALAHPDPHQVLGPHLEEGRLVLRVFRPGAEGVWIRWRNDGAAAASPMTRLHAGGIFELHCDETELPAPGDYRVELRDGPTPWLEHDPYAFWPTLGDLDVHLMGEGKHRMLHQILGAHARTHQDVDGTAFAVWAPDARRVSLVGDFNGWDGHRHVMRRLGSGVWEIFAPAVTAGAVYKFEVWKSDGELIAKSDPLGREMELRPSNASRVTASRHQWRDTAWLQRREATDSAQRPMSIYEVHLGSWRHHEGPQRHADRPNWLSYRELADQLVDYVADLGFTHIELMPVMEHPFDGSWGYQVGGFYAPTSRYGSPDDFRAFVDRCHERGIGVIIDWVPAHFPKDSFGLGRFDGTALYEHLDPRKGEHRQWGTYVFNYGRNEVRNFLIANALYWLDEFHVDGLRADAVASMLYLDYAAERPGDWAPNEHGGRENLEAITFLRELNDAVHDRFPGAMVIAEESTAWPGVTHPTAAGGLGFDFKWNMGWMHDTLDYFTQDPVFRSYHHQRLTFGLLYAFSERFVLPLSHDEVVHLKKSLLSKMAGDRWQMLANLRSLLAHMWAHPGKKLLFMGAELGQWDEWDESKQLDWSLLNDPDHGGLHRLVRDLNRCYRRYPALHEADDSPQGFRWIDANDTHQSVASYLRFPRSGPSASGEPSTDHDYVICVANLTPVPRERYRIGVPAPVRHAEIVNTDATIYGGSGMGNLGSVEVSSEPCHGHGQSLELTLPPLAALWLAPEPLVQRLER
ncbi:MAG: 1,4-alpha-glucan branching protein GlgB [Deltaproteobacteria bacterium]|nr:1,4-alpha-glucan branching protein GlgB [Deltaproteobacteria bacterium]